ncbi:MAG: methylated-DNA--[protein]-cysteine S-methyltransferase, partial [Anaerovoracaceae bacterium]
MKTIFKYDINLGLLSIVEEDNKIVRVTLSDINDVTIRNEETALIRQTYSEIMEYLQGKRKTFDIPLQLHGTEFQLKVWEELKNIPYGETISYKELARRVGSPKGCRAVGQANNKNPIPIIIPCHRVIGEKGKLVGYNGGVEIKQFLLELE